MDFENAAKKACLTKLEDAKSSYQRVDEGNRPYLCMDLVYQYTLLTVGFGRLCVGTMVHDKMLCVKLCFSVNLSAKS